MTDPKVPARPRQLMMTFDSLRLRGMSAAERRARYHPTMRPSRGAHCSASVVFPYPEPATSVRTRAPDLSSARISRGRSMIRRFRILGFRGSSAIRIGGVKLLHSPQFWEEDARGRRVRTAGVCRQRLRGGRSLTRAGT